MDLSDDTFKQYYMKLMQISPNSITKDELLDLITKLNDINYNEKLPFITTWTCTDMLLHVMGLFKKFGYDELCLVQLSQLIINVASKQKIIVCSMSVNVILHGLKDVWFEILAKNSFSSRSQELCGHLLGAISAVVYGNGAYIMPELLEWLVGKNGKSGSVGLLLFSPISMELKKMCLQCLSGLCMTSVSREDLNEEYMQCCLQLFIQALQTIPHIKDVHHYKVIFASHKGLQYILSGPSCIHVRELGPLLAIMKKHLVFGLPMALNDFPCVLEPLPIPDAIHSKAQDPQQVIVIPTGKRLKKKKKRKHPKQVYAKPSSTASSNSHAVSKSSSAAENESSTFETTATTLFRSGSSHKGLNELSSDLHLLVTSSESEYSDTEGGQLSAMTSFALKIRQMALGSLYIIVKKTSKLVMLGYWNSFVSSSSVANNVSLLSCVTSEPALKARIGALMVLCAMLDGSRTFLSLAIQKGISTSYVSFSDMLSSSVHDIHNTLLKALTKERSSVVQVHIMKAISSLAANSPYTKLTKGFVTNIVSKVQVIMTTSHDTDCHIGALNVFMSLLGSDPALEELISCITETNTSLASNVEDNGDHTSYSKTLSGMETKSWLIEKCLNLSQKSSEMLDVPLPLRVAALQLLATACKQYFLMIKFYVHDLTSVVSYCLDDKNATVRLHSSKLIQELGGSLLKHQQGDQEILAISLTYWKNLLSGPIQRAAQDEEDYNRSHVCDFLATVGSEVFETLSRELQVYCQTLLLGLTSDENYMVRSASIRALAVYIMYPVLRKDIFFVEDVAGCVLRLMKDSAKGVQYNAAWSFGNLTDAIIINVENEAESFSRDMIRNSLLMELIGTAIKSADNKDKVRFNMMRVLGNMLRFFTQDHLQKERFHNVVSQAKVVIVNAMLKDPLMKVRWNACLACGNLLRNVHLPLNQSGWADDVYTSLCATVSSFKNYKVCIKAAIALGCPSTRESLGKHFTAVYACILDSLQRSEKNEVAFGEYKFKDKLQEHLVYTLLHLTTFLKLEDLAAVSSRLCDSALFDAVKMQLLKWHNVLSCKLVLGNLTINESEGYAALGQFTDAQKRNMFENASARWNSLMDKFLDSDVLKNMTIDPIVVSNIKMLFDLSQETTEVDSNSNVTL